jgi:hypothetical protein
MITFRAFFWTLPLEERESVYEHDESRKDLEGSVNDTSKGITL